MKCFISAFDVDYQNIEYIDQLTFTFGNEFLFFATVKSFYNEFNRGRRSLVRKSRQGCQTIEAVQKLMM